MIILNGDQSHVTTPLAATIVGLANNGSGQVRVQTSSPHFFGNRDYVHVVTTGTVIDSYFSIAVIDATHFDLLGSTYTGTGTGTATDQSLSPAFAAPTDGDTASLQLSGMLSSLQALGDRTQALRYLQVRGAQTLLAITADGTYALPPWTTKVLLWGCGGGGGGGGGSGGYSATPHAGFPGGSGGSGAELGFAILSVSSPSIVVAIGAGGAGGASAASGGTTVDGDDGAATTCTIGGTLHFFPGGSGGGGGNTPGDPGPGIADNSTAPVWVPGASGPAGFFRSGPPRRQWSPGPRQVTNIGVSAGNLFVNLGAGDWAASVYEDPAGQRYPGDGGGSMFTSNPTYSGSASYAGVRSREGYLGGNPGSAGSSSGNYPGGAAGGGGGGGAFGVGGDGGDGGDGNNAGNGTTATAGGTPSANTGAGGGGGGVGGNASGTGGHGGNGAPGGSGRVWVLCLGVGA